MNDTKKKNVNKRWKDRVWIRKHCTKKSQSVVSACAGLEIKDYDFLFLFDLFY